MDSNNNNSKTAPTIRLNISITDGNNVSQNAAVKQPRKKPNHNLHNNNIIISLICVALDLIK